MAVSAAREQLCVPGYLKKVRDLSVSKATKPIRY